MKPSYLKLVLGTTIGAVLGSITALLIFGLLFIGSRL